MKREELMCLEKEEIIDLFLAYMEKTNEILKQQAEEIAQLKAQVNQNSRNSSKPPSSDGYKKPSSSRQKGGSGKKAGGQKGHEGVGFSLTREPDLHVWHEPEQCATCDQTQECATKKSVSETRYEVDIKVSTTITAHQRIKRECPKDNHKAIVGCFPKGNNSTMQYGVNLEALALALNTSGMVSINRTHELLSDVFGVPISTGTIAAMVKNYAEAVRPTVAKIKEALLLQPVLHFDETGMRVEDKLHWAHVSSNRYLTYITLERKRGKEGIDASGVLPNYRGTAIHDCWSAYFRYDDIRHGVCDGHILRELKGVTENTSQTWAQEMAELLLQMKEDKESLLKQGISQAPPSILQKHDAAYDAIISKAQEQNPCPEATPDKRGRPAKGKVRALVDRLVQYKGAVCLFLTDFTVPFDNNQAERDFRMVKVKQKVSGCFRTKDGADYFVAIMSFTGTARKLGFSSFFAIRDALLSRSLSLAWGATE